jgi:hypothetical protein
MKFEAFEKYEKYELKVIPMTYFPFDISADRGKADHVTVNMFTDPPSPLTSLGDPNSSPWPSPCRHVPKKKERLKLFCKKKDHNLQTFGDNHKFIQSPHWHLSRAHHTSTSYCGRHILDQNRTVFPKDLSPDLRLKALEDSNYKLVKFEK